MRPCCSEFSSALCSFAGGIYFVFLLLSLIYTFYNWVASTPRRAPSGVSVMWMLWLATRFIELSFWHVAPENSDGSEAQYCTYMSFRVMPMYFYMQAAFLLVMKLLKELMEIQNLKNKNQHTQKKSAKCT